MIEDYNEIIDGQAETKKLRWKFDNFHPPDWNKSQSNTFTLSSDPSYLSTERFFRVLSSGQKCFKVGTDSSKTPNSADKCVCTPNYHGQDCGVPDAVWFGSMSSATRKNLRVRTRMRRLIHALPVNHEYDFFETRVRSLEEVVDVFIIQESNYTTFGTPKDLLFLDKLQKGWLSDVQDKILWVLLPYFADRGKDNGWYADSFIRMYLSKMGLKLVHNQDDEDIYLLLDADELPLPEVLLFLKLYDGYTQPIRFGFRWTVFGFFWLKAEDPGVMENIPLIGKLIKAKPKERLLQLWVACTLGMLRDVYSNNAMLLRRNVWENELLADKLKNFTSKIIQNSGGTPVRQWDVGKLGHYAGYHCSWCYSPEGIRTKLLSAQKHDKPRWGDYPEKTNLTYIAELIKTGGWFDNTRPFIQEKWDVSNKFYAPQYILKHKDRFQYLLKLPEEL